MADPAVPLSLNSRGADVKELHDSLRKLGYAIPKHELDEQLFAAGTQHAILSFQTRHKLRRTGSVDDRTRSALTKAVAVAETAQQRVEGRILFEYGLPAANLRLRLYSRGFAGPPVRLAESATDHEGFYLFSYDPGAAPGNVEVRAIGTGDEEIALSAVKFNVERHEVLNLVAPAALRPLAPEFDRLTGDLAAHLGSLEKLAAARENHERHDLTLLHESVGWDARLIALAASAVKASAETGLAAVALYALFRAGLPTDPQRLARVSLAAVEKALRKANRAAIVRLDDKDIAAAGAAFEKFARRTRREARVPGALSSLHELLANSGLTEVEEDTLADLYFAVRNAPGELWKRARERGLSDAKIANLRLLGKLAYLTFNNAILAASLRNEIASPDDLAPLVDRDLHRAETWKVRLRQMAQNSDDDLSHLIPPAYGGATVAERLDGYADDLARTVRLSFPTHVVRRMIETDELRLGPEHSLLKANVGAFLKSASRLGFELGRAPVNAFIRKHQDQLFPSESPEVEATIRGVKTLARLYQATPTDAALKAVYSLGFSSAHEIAAWPHRAFLDRFAREFPTREEAELTYRKARQISAVTSNVVTMAKLMDTAPRVYALFPRPQSPEEGRREEARDRLISHFATLESLFGSVDFCECEHCRSVLSPAAYFVDLLQFLEREHAGSTPYRALIERRPDLPHVPLTCENTNTAVPYIDLVNEILEYYVAHGLLSEEAAHDTGGATTAELLTEPQRVLPAAYDRLVEARYPLGLPFDLWLETVRRFLDYFGTPLWQVLEAFRPTDELFADPLVAPYDRAAIFAEYLGISPSEYRIFTAPDPPSWYELYGYASRDAATQVARDAGSGLRVDLNSAKTLARRLGVSYQEIVQVVRTAFVNPGPGSIRLVGADEDRCDFNETALEDADGNSLDDLVFLRINLFVRLWRKLGWTIEETDRVLRAFVPANALPLTAENIGDALRTALVYVAHLKTLGERVGLGRTGPPELLNVWSNPSPDQDPLAGLAQALNLSIPECVALKELSGLDPLMPIGADPIGRLDDDHPFSQTLRFVEVAQTVRDSGFAIETLDYLLRHRFDPVGTYRSDPDSQLALVRALAVDLRRLRAEHAVPANPAQASALTDEVLRQKLALVLAPDVLATFMGMWTGTLEIVEGEAEDFFEKYLQRHPIDEDTRAGFLEAGDFDVLFGAGHTDAERRFRLATALLEYLQDALGRQLVGESAATALGADRPLVEALLNGASLLSEPGHAGTPLVEALAAAGAAGVTATFYASEDGSGDPLATLAVTDVDLDVIDPATGTPVRPDGTNSARFEGYLEVPAAGAYRFFLDFEGGNADAELRLADLPDFVLRGTADDGAVDQIATNLRAGVPYRFTFDVRRLTGGVHLSIQGEHLPKDSLAQVPLYSAAALDRARRACMLLAKSLRLIQGLGLSEREVRYLLTHRADFEDLDLGDLPTGADQVSPAGATALFGQFLRLADYASLKRMLAARSDDLVAIFEANPLDDKCARIAEVTRRDAETVRAAVEQLGLEADDLVHEQGLLRLWKALQIAGKPGVAVPAIAALTGIVARENTPEERARKVAIATDLKHTIKARFEPDPWRRLAQPIFDELRQRQRDALVGYVLHHHPEGFDNANQLFEYFLIDPGMEPVVQTSRIRLAISSVQQFVQRCLLNLERDVQASAIDSRHWQWMKHYRVWEANRKIFLFPENWLEPEFRDDKTHLFQELEGALLQSDVSNELAEDAFFNYLKGLERLARLDIVAMYCEEGSDPASDVFHVVGRTFSRPHKYFYRRHAYRMWTPWEPVTAEIEGDHIVAVVWRERLHLFWLTFLEKALKDPDTGTTFGDLADETASTGARRALEVQLNWSEYFQGRWTTRESSGFEKPLRMAEGYFDRWSAVVHASKEGRPDEDALLLHLEVTTASEMTQSATLGAFRLVSKHSPPRSAAGERPERPPFADVRAETTAFAGSGPLTIVSSETDILREGRDFRLLFGGGQSDRATLGRRFFYQDDQHSFFVEPSPPAMALPAFEDLGIPGMRPDLGLDADDRWNEIFMDAGVQGVEPDLVVDPDDPRWVDPRSTFAVHDARDWVTDPATVLHFDERVIGQQGGQEFAIVPEGAEADLPERRVEVSPGSELPAGQVLIARGGPGSSPRQRLTVVGGGGLTSVLLRDVTRNQGNRALRRPIR